MLQAAENNAPQGTISVCPAMPDPAHWLNKLRHLKTHRSATKGMAPHKPCLLLSLLDMAQDGEL
jgi:hypothetical protein